MDAALVALVEISDPVRFLMLFCGVIAGLIIGVIPGLGGIFGMALIVPLTYHMDPYTAMALLLGMGSVTTTSDTIPAVLLGVPGTVGSTATVLDGHALAKKNQAARAFGAAYSASLIGGLFGALVLALSIPVMRPMILLMKTPDFLAISLLGLCFVAFLSGNRPLKGIVAVLFGILVSSVGIDGQTAIERFTFGSIYLWDGLPLGVVFLGIFGLPELADLLKRGNIASEASPIRGSSMIDGFRDTLREWKLVLQCSTIGSIVGAIPGVGLSVIDWIAYGVAVRKPGDGVPYGEGNIRGVIAPESANNAKEGGALIPTIAFGLPGSPSMSILLGAFIVHGLVPGRGMIEENLPVTYAMIFSIAIANVLGAAICLGMTRPLARIANIPSNVLVPIALIFITLGAFQTHASIADIVVLLGFGALGMFMKSNGWPRAAFALGFVLGPSVERYYFLSYQISGNSWLLRPSVLLIILIGLALVIRRTFAWKRARGEKAPVAHDQGKVELATYLILIFFSGWVLLTTLDMPLGARLFPQISAGFLLGVIILLAGQFILQRRRVIVQTTPEPRFSYTMPVVLVLSAMFTALLFVTGPISAVFLFLTASLFYSNRDRPIYTFLTALGASLVVYLVFDMLVSIPWPDTILPLP